MCGSRLFNAHTHPDLYAPLCKPIYTTQPSKYAFINTLDLTRTSSDTDGPKVLLGSCAECSLSPPAHSSVKTFTK